MKLELLIFDCDGVLVDSEELANRVLTEELGRLGLARGAEEVGARFKGLSLARTMELVAQELGRDVPAGFVERLQRRTYEALREGVRPVRGVREALLAIRTPVCVASSGEREKMRLTLGATGLLPRFEGRMFSATEVARGKPHPDLFLHAASRMGAAPRHCVVVEDSVPGVLAAAAAGMLALGYAPCGNGRELRSNGARTFDDMARLAGLIEELAQGDA